MSVDISEKKIRSLCLTKVDLRRIRSTLIVTHNGRSGAHLFSNLMDNHSEVLSCPPDSLQWIVEDIHSESLISCVDSGKLTCEVLVDWIVSHCPLLFNTSSKKNSAEGTIMRTDLSGFRVERGMLVNVDEFREIAVRLIRSHMKHYSQELKSSDIFSLIHWAYAMARGRELSTDNPVICWQRHNFILPESLDSVLKTTINPILITTVRRFEDSLDSFFSWLEPHYEQKVEMFRVVFGCFVFNLNKRLTGFPEWAIRFEDMHLHTEKLMKNICFKLGISFEPTLLKTTLDGLPCIWSVRGRLITGTNNNLKKSGNFKILNDADIIFLNLLLARFYRYFDYDFHHGTLAFVKCDPPSLDLHVLTNYLGAIQSTKKSYLANLIFEAMPEDALNLRHLLSRTWNSTLEPLELII